MLRKIGIIPKWNDGLLRLMSETVADDGAACESRHDERSHHLFTAIRARL